MPSARITVRNVETGITRTLQTDSTGHYVAPNLAPGDYEIQAELAGFQTEIRRGIVLTLGREAVVDFSLQVGQVQEQVVVTAEAPLIDTTSAAVAGLVDQKQVTDLPLNGRSLTQLTTLQPGILLYRSASSLTGTGQNITINGARTRQVNFLLNGTGTLNFFGKSPGGISGDQLGVEGVREFTVLSSSYSAEFGRSAGGVINAITKSGTNAFHGSLYEYLRNSALDAREFFDPEVPPFKRNQFGASLGGPIRKDQTFFFANVEFLRERLGQSLVRTFPTAAARQGNLPGSAIVVATAIKPFLDLMPIPTGQDLNNGTARHNISFSQPTDQNYVNARVDHRISDADSLYGSYVLDDSDRTTVGAVLDFPTALPNRNQYVSLEENRILSSTLLNTFHIGFNRSTAIQVPECSDTAAKLTFVPGACPRISGSGIISDPSANFGPRIFVVNSFQYSDTLGWTRGSHQFKFGGYFERFRVNGRSQISPGGNYGYNTVEQFLTGNMLFFEGPKPGVNFQRGLRQNLFAFFGNDAMQVRPNLTVNLGVRYEFISSPTEVNGKMANIDSINSPAPRVGEHLFQNPSLLNFSPRVGIAWSPGSSRKTSVRAGFGIYYDQLLHNVWLDGGFQVPPFWYEGRFTNTPATPLPFPNAYSLLEAGNVPFPSSFVFATDGNPPQTHTLQYNLSIQRQLPGEIVVQVGYVGSGGRNVGRIVDNEAVPVVLADGRISFPAPATRRNPNFAEVRFKLFDTTSSYNGFQLMVRKRASHGVGFQVSYTLSKALDMMSDFQGTGDIFNDHIFSTLPEYPQLDKGRAAFDARHNFVLNFTGDLPVGPGKSLGGHLQGVMGKLLGGWQGQSIISLQTGLPTGALLGFDNARLASTRRQLRPDLNPGFNSDNVVLGPPNQTKDPFGRYLNPLAFSVPPAGFLGNLGRNPYSGPGLATVDFSLIKSTAITESTKLEFRSEFFNLFNRPNFGYPAPNGSMVAFTAATQTQPINSFSTITSVMTSARQIQFAMKLTF